MLNIHCTVRLTRRRTISQVLDQDGNPLFSSMSVVECISYIEGQGQTSIPIRDGDYVWWIQLIKCEKEAPPWEALSARDADTTIFSGG